MICLCFMVLVITVTATSVTLLHQNPEWFDYRYFLRHKYWPFNECSSNINSVLILITLLL